MYRTQTLAQLELAHGIFEKTTPSQFLKKLGLIDVDQDLNEFPFCLYGIARSLEGLVHEFSFKRIEHDHLRFEGTLTRAFAIAFSHQPTWLKKIGL